MWKRDNEPAAPGTPAPSSATPRSEAEPAPPPRHAAPATPVVSGSGERAVLSPSIVLRGEVSGDEDLVIEGRVEGKITLRQNVVTVGAKGRVAAEIHARAVLVDGEVDGNVNAEEQVVLRKTSRVRGDVVAPRVTIEDGARFKGSIDMEPKQRANPAPAPAPRPAVKEEPGPRPLESKPAIQAG